MLGVIEREHDAFSAVHTTHALHRLAKKHCALHTHLHSTNLAGGGGGRDSTYYEYVQPALLILNKLVVKHVRSFEPWHCCMAIWAYGKLEHCDEVCACMCLRACVACVCVCVKMRAQGRSPTLSCPPFRPSRLLLGTPVSWS